jgi:hypothetical protein
VNLPAALPGALTVPGGAGYQADLPVRVTASAGQTVLTVGPDGAYQTIGAAVAAAQNGDLILVAPGTYVNDFADVTSQITIAGAGGMVNLVATEPLPNEKGIFIVDNSCQIDNFTFQGAAIPDSEGGNGAGIRYQGGTLVLDNDAFLDNQNGIMGSAVDNLPQNDVTITDCTFDNNGQSSGPNAGYTHNIYVGFGVDSVVATHDVFERANVGHEFKSRAESNYVSNDIFYDGPDGTASYSIDLPDGGADTVSGNVIEKGPDTQNNNIIHFGGEGIPYAGSALRVTGNDFVNELGASAVAVLNQTTLEVSITGNIFDNFAAATLADGSYTQSGNVDQNGRAIAPGSSNDFAAGTDLYDFSADSRAHSVTLTTQAGVRGGGGLLTVAAEAGHVTVVGGAGGLQYQEAAGWGGSEIQTAAGAADTISAPGQDTIEAGGRDLIIGGAGNMSAALDGDDTVRSGTGNNGYSVDGTLYLTGQGGSDTVQVNSAAAAAHVSGMEAYYQTTTNGGLSVFDIRQGGAAEQATISGGGVAVQVYHGGINATTAGGTGGADISFGAGTVTALFSEGNDTIHAGSGPATIQAGGSAAIYGGSGPLALFGHGIEGMATLYGGSGAATIAGDTGNILFVGAASGGTLDAALSNITIDGGAGMLRVTGGSRQVVRGGSGGLVFGTAGGDDSITTAARAHDTISLTDASLVVSNGIDRINDGDGNSTVTANGNATITGSTGAADYTLNGNDMLMARGYTRATVGGSAAALVQSAGSLTSVSVAGGTLYFSEVANSDGEAATVKGAGVLLQDSAAADADTITLGSAGDGAALGGGHQVVGVAASGTRVWANAGSDTVDIYAGGGTVWGGAAAVYVSMDDWHDALVTTVFGGGGALVQAAGAGSLVFSGGGGSAVLGGVTGGETVTAGTGNITLAGGGGGTRFVAGGGHAQATLTAAGGTVVFGAGQAAVTEAGSGSAVIYDFVAGHGGGADTISGFRAGTDRLVFQGVTVLSSVVGGGATMLVLSDGTHVMVG